VAFDCWCQASENPPESEVRFELMVWFAYSQDYLGYGADYLAERPTLNGLRWKVLPLCIRNTDGTGQVDTVSFLIDGANVWSVSEFDVTAHLRWIVDHRNLFGPSAVLDRLGDWYLTGVEFGTEAYKGQGTLNVLNYDVAVVPAGPDPEPEPIAPIEAVVRVQLAAACLSEATKSGLEDEAVGIPRAYRLADTLWEMRDQ
jgi:hypothetical protein